MSWRWAGLGLTILVLVGTGLVAAGVGQGAPPRALPISAAAKAREIRRVAAAGHEVHTGERLFSSDGCAACHSLAAGGYDGRLGPRLDVQSQGSSVKDIIANILHPPDDDSGYEAGLMPENFAARLSARDLHALAVYVHAAASAAKG